MKRFYQLVILIIVLSLVSACAPANPIDSVKLGSSPSLKEISPTACLVLPHDSRNSFCVFEYKNVVTGQTCVIVVNSVMNLAPAIDCQ